MVLSEAPIFSLDVEVSAMVLQDQANLTDPKLSHGKPVQNVYLLRYIGEMSFYYILERKDKASWWCLRIFTSRIYIFVISVQLQAPQSVTGILDFMFFLPSLCLGPIITGLRNKFSQLTLSSPIMSE